MSKIPQHLLQTSLVVTVSSQHWDNTSKLLTDLMTGYDKRIRPVLNQSHPVNVNVSMYLMTLQDIDAVSGRAAIVASIFIAWMDQKLYWNGNAYNGIYSVTIPVKDIWYPKLILSNPFSEIKDITADWMTVTVYQGFVSLSATAIFEATCEIDATYYPFDSQACHFAFTPLSYAKSAVALIPTYDKIDTQYYSEDREWNLNSTQVLRFETTYVDTLVFLIQIDRKSGFIVINILMPIIVMLILNLFVFVIPADAGERISYAMTVLLALAVFLTLVGDNLPKTSEPVPLMSYYLMAIMILSAAMCVLTIVNLRLYHKDDESSPPAWCRAVTRVVLCRKCTHESRKRPVKASNINNHTAKITNGAIVLETNQCFTEDIETDVIDVTWKNVSKAVDVLAVIIFTLALIIINAYFMHTLQYGKRNEPDFSDFNSSK